MPQGQLASEHLRLLVSDGIANTATNGTYQSGSALPGSGTTYIFSEAKMPNDDLTDAKIAAAEARTDTKLARLEGKIDRVLDSVETSRSEARDNRRAIIANVWVVFAAVAALIVGLAAVFPTVYDLGAKNREAISRDVNERFQIFEDRLKEIMRPPSQR